MFNHNCVKMYCVIKRYVCIELLAKHYEKLLVDIMEEL